MRKGIRTALIVLSLMAWQSTVNAKVVDHDEAMQVATNFLRVSGVREVWNSNNLTVSGVATLSTTETPTFYVFVPDTGKGFVIVSADDSTPSVLGYSLDKEIAVGDDMPCNFRWWCEAMDKQIVQFRQTGAVSVKKELNGGVSTLAASELLYETAQWNQYEPYNLQCPKDGNDLSVTGCGPTSIAIAMRYHNFPEHGVKASDAYTTESKSIYVASRDLPNHYYDWDNMLLEYGNTWSEAEGEAVATLIADIGSVAQVDYSSTGTNMAVGLGLTGQQFYNYFNYSSMMSILYSSMYSDADWTEIIKNEIATNGPMPYLSALMVHQFILDGYNSEDYFHINWGWGGYDNGYFLLPDIVEGADEQLAYIDFFPDDGKGLTSLQLYKVDDYTGVVADTDVFAQNETFTMNMIYFFNSGMVDFTGVVAFGLTDSDGNIKELISGEVGLVNLGPLYMIGIYPSSCTIRSEINPGDCIRLCYQNDAEDDWHCMLAGDEGMSYRIVITEDMIGEPVELEYELTLCDPGLTIDADVFYPGVEFIAGVRVLNSSGITVTTNVRLGLTDSEDNLKEWIAESMEYSEVPWYYTTYSNISCTITGEITAGDRIRAFYQGNPENEDSWKVLETYYGETCPSYFEITEDMIQVANVGDKIYDSTSELYYNVLSETEVEVTRKDDDFTYSQSAITIPETITYGGVTYTVIGVGDNAFFYALNLSSLDIPSTVASIGYCAFINCMALDKITVAEDNPYFCIVDNVLFSKDMTALVKAPISIGTTYTIPESVTVIKDNALAYCTSLGEVTIPESVVTIEDYAFARCTSLSTIVIPNSVITMGMQAFWYCDKLTTLTIGSGVESLGVNAFNSCSLSSIITLNPTPPTFVNNSPFFNCSAIVSVPAGTLAEYKNVWGESPYGVTGYDELDYAVLKITTADGADGYATYYDGDYDIDLSETGMTAYWAENVEGNTVTLTEIESEIVPAKTAVVLKGALTNYAPAQVSSPTSDASEYTSNMLHGHSTTGMLEEEETGTYLYYMLTTNTSGENLGFYWGADGGAPFSSKANKAWLAVPQTSGANGLSIRFKDKDEDTTGISSVSANYGENDAIYTIQGIRVNDMKQRGVYIVNGRKVLVR